MRKMRKFSQGGRAEARRDRRMADIEKDYQRAIAKGKSEKEAKAKRDQRVADARDDYAKRTGADRTETRAAEKAAEERLSRARRSPDKDMKPVSVLSGGDKSVAAKADMPKVDTPKVGDDKPKAASYDSMSFGAAFRQAMKDKGRGETFTWKGKSYKLETADATPARKSPRAAPAPAPANKSPRYSANFGAPDVNAGARRAVSARSGLPAPVEIKAPLRGFPAIAERRRKKEEERRPEPSAAARAAADIRRLSGAKFAKGGKVDGIAVRGKTKLKRKK